MTEALGCVKNLFGVGLFTTASDLHDGMVGESLPIVEPQEIAAPWNYQCTIAVLFTVKFRPHMKVHLVRLKGGVASKPILWHRWQHCMRWAIHKQRQATS